MISNAGTFTAFNITLESFVPVGTAALALAVTGARAGSSHNCAICGKGVYGAHGLDYGHHSGVDQAAIARNESPDPRQPGRAPFFADHD